VDVLAAALPVARAEASSLAATARSRYEETVTPEIVFDQLIRVYEATISG
jgi:hypothetical protein